MGDKREPPAWSPAPPSSPVTDQPGGDGGSQPLQVAAPATAERALEMRRRVYDWLSEIGASAEVVTDLQLAVYEALANVVEHAYPAGAPLAPMWLSARVEGGEVLVTISDAGRWRDREPEPYRGQGLELMRQLTTMRLASGSRGTTVHLCAPRVVDGATS